jgi:hypothetical protein
MFIQLSFTKLPTTLPNAAPAVKWKIYPGMNDKPREASIALHLDEGTGSRRELAEGDLVVSGFIKS